MQLKECYYRTQELFFENLTPVNEIDISVYEEAIDYVFDNTDITNVAICGSYSAGKSSVMEVYILDHNFDANDAEYLFQNYSRFNE